MPDCPCLLCGHLRMGPNGLTCARYGYKVDTDCSGLPVQIATCTIHNTDNKED